MTTNWSAFEEKLGVFQGIPRIVESVGAYCSLEARKDVQSFFSAHPVPAAERTLRQALETIDTCASVRARQQGPLAAWLKTSH